ncbi:MAG: hypothetical protein ABJC79_15860 [Acidimicrobiia bacterium]
MAVTSVAARLTSLGIVLPGPYPPHDPLDAVVVHGRRARTSGQLPRDHEGTIVHQGVLGDAVSVEAGAEAARWCEPLAPRGLERMTDELLVATAEWLPQFA